MKRKKLLTLILAIMYILFVGITIASADEEGIYTYSVKNGEVTINDCEDTASGEIIIPDTLGGYPVTSIGSYAFQGCVGVTDVVIPEGVKSIGYQAFQNCRGLTSITIPKSVTSISNYAFLGCDYLTDVYIKDIESWCKIDFNNSTSTPLRYADNLYIDGILTNNIVIPDTIKEIKKYTFYNFSGITGVTIPKGVTSIGERAFYGCDGLTEITIPDSVTSIGSSAFDDCKGLKSIVIPDSVTSIRSSAFAGCTGLIEVYISDIESWCNIDFNENSANPLSYAENLYVNGKLTRNIVIPDTVKALKENTFSYFTGIASVTIPDSITSIEDNTFHNCTGLVKVTIPDSITSIGDEAFSNCTGLANITIPDGVTSIGNSAFYNCTGLKSIVIPDSVTSIGSSAFYYCKGLLEVYITDIESWCNIDFVNGYSNPLRYADNLYIDGELTRDIVIPYSVKAIKNYAFDTFTGIAKLDTGDGVASIGNYAFYNCSGLTNVTIGENVTNIGNSAFSGCTGLVKAIIGNSVISIGNSAFYNCQGLAEVSIPDSVTNIGNNAFYNCYAITKLTVPYNVTSIGTEAFRNCTGLTRIIVESGVDLIPENAFYNCSKLKYVYLPSEVLYIRNNAFAGCSKIEEVFYEGSEAQWQEILFYNGNTSLTNAKIIYSPEKRTFKFKTNCETALSDITDYAVFTAPTVKNDGKTLAGWYDNEALTGTPVTFPYYGNATTLYAAWIDRTGLSFDDAFVAKENKQYTVTISETNQVIYYEFVPEFTGEYRFYSTGNLNTVGYLYDSSKKQLKYDDDNGDGNNFYMAYNLNAGEIYYIATKIYNATGSFTLFVETDCIPETKTVCVTASTGEKIFISIPSYLPEDSTVILACYNDGRFVEMKSTLNKNETIYFIVNNKFDSAKVMVWEDFESMKPICAVENVL